MLELLLNIDTALFLWINHGTVNIVLDVVMPLITSVKNWYIVYILGFILLIVRHGTQGRICTAMLCLSVLITDPLNSRIVKPYFNRVRPSTSVTDSRVLVPDNGGKSFPSTHATNNFAAAFILSFFYPKRKHLWYFVASMIAFSRVYVGVHYPGDVIAGAIEGVIIAFLLTLAFQKIQLHVTMKKNSIH